MNNDMRQDGASVIITQITELSRNRSKVYIDYEFAFVLYKGELHMYHLQEGSEISEENYQDIVTKVLPQRAKLRTMNLLQKRSYTEYQLRKKLEEGFYPAEIIDLAVEYVKHFHYVDDLQYAKDYLNYHEGNKPKKRMERDLIEKGVSKDVIYEAFVSWEDESGQDEKEMICKLLEKKKYHTDFAVKEKQKLYGYLVRKGYSRELVQEVMGKFYL